MHPPPSIYRYDGLLWGDCAVGAELANQPPPAGWINWLVMKLLLPFAYPVRPELDGIDELPCID